MRGGKRAGAGRTSILDQWYILLIGGACERRLQDEANARMEQRARDLARQRANAHYQKSPNSPVPLTDEEFVVEYEQHVLMPPQIEEKAHRDVAMLIRKGLLAEEDRETHEDIARRTILRSFRRAVLLAAVDEEPKVPDYLEDALNDAVYALKNRRAMLEVRSRLTTLPKNEGMAVGRATHIEGRRSKVSTGRSVREQIISDVSAHSDELFGRSFSKHIVRQAWRLHTGRKSTGSPSEF